jgi:carboxyl-terminal processing protease|tara:strand:+ start:2317 stop:3597 length:1281 start_codon:yes stop_codon:yes gene_type:complete
MNFFKRIIVIALGATFLALAYQFGMDVAQQGGLAPYWESRQKAAEIRSALRLISVYYVDGEAVELDGLSESAIVGMIEELDPYSEYLDFNRLRQLGEETSQEFGGIGVQVEMRDEFLTVIAPIGGSPGERAGLVRGDRIVGVDGESIEGLNISKSVAELKGKPGTQVAILIERSEVDERFEVEVIRELIEVDNVHGAEILESGIGYLRISQFGKRTGDEMVTAIESLLEQGMDALMIDLRNNPGGLLDVAVEVVEKFVPAGQLVVYTKGRHEAMSEEWYAQADGDPYGFPIVVLVNPGSASASEIVAAALKDSGRAQLVGAKTFGKGSVQSILPLGKNTGLKLTTAKYYTPGGYVIHENGIEPDVLVEITTEEEGYLAIQRNRLSSMPLEEFVERFEFEPIEDEQMNAAKGLLLEALGKPSNDIGN